MPEGEGGEARGRLSCSRVIDLALVAEGSDGPVTFAFRVVGVPEEFDRGRIESALPCGTI